VYNSKGNVDVIIDVVGYYSSAAGDGFTPLTPARIQDSRPSGPKVGPYSTPWAGNQTRNVQVTGSGGVPSGADAVVANVTVTDTTEASFLTIWPQGGTKPLVSSLNWTSKQTIPNAVTVKLSAGGQISVYNSKGNANVIIDVVGYFTSGSGAKFHPLAPARIQDSRPNGPKVGAYSTPWPGNTTRSVQVSGAGGVPASASAALLNFTVTDTTGNSFLTIWPQGGSKPLVSSLNWVPAQTIPNQVTAKLSAGGVASVFNLTGNVNVIADVAGWYG
jgi:hypothetical protein